MSTGGCVKQATSSKMESPSKKNIVEIYTDWANHYLEKTKVRYGKDQDLSVSQMKIVFRVNTE